MPRAQSRPPVKSSKMADGLMAAVIGLVEAVIVLAVEVLQQPVFMLPLLVVGGGGGAAYYFLGAVPAVAVPVGIGAVFGAWAHWRPVSFEWWVRRRARNAWVRFWRYELKWSSTMGLAGLTNEYVTRGGKRRVREPRILHVDVGEWRDRVLVKMAGGVQSIENWQRVDITTGLAATYGARLGCRVRKDPKKTQRIWLEFIRKDPLKFPQPMIPIPETVDLRAVEVGVTDDGAPWTINVVGTHLLIGGTTGAGKGSVLWSLLLGMAPRIRDLTVQVWIVDPKGGMELGIGEELAYRFAVSPEETMDLLKAAVATMETRTRALRKRKMRLHEPTVAEPHIVVVLDEFAAMTFLADDQSAAKVMGRLVGKLLTQGRAAGVSCVVALQDPRKEVLPMRDLFNRRVALRLESARQVPMLLSDDAVEQGARCHDPDVVSPLTPGVGFVRIEGVSEPQRVRAAYPTDADIIAAAAKYGPKSTALGRARMAMEGQKVPVKLTAEQQREYEAIRRLMEEVNLADELVAKAPEEDDVDEDRPRSIA